MGRSLTRPALFSCLAVILSAQDAVRLEHVMLAPAVIQQRLEAVPRTLPDRQAALVALFRQAGCETEEQRVPQSKAPNLICILPGESGSTIVVGGHFDFIDHGTGVVDDWSGVVLLPSLYQSLKTHARRHRYVFVAFAGEEAGLLGSKQYVKKLAPEERRDVRAMINLECLGTTETKVWASRADKQLLGEYARAARSMNLPASASNVEKVGDDDSHPFLNARMPVLTMHSVTNQTIGFLHNSRDNLDAIHPSDYYDAYRLATTFLALLDSDLR